MAMLLKLFATLASLAATILVAIRSVRQAMVVAATIFTLAKFIVILLFSALLLIVLYLLLASPPAAPTK
jgi:hypothetical protein